MSRSRASRLGLLATIGSAVRSALRPGTPGLLERVSAVPRLVRAAARGDYPHASRGHLAMLVVAALYVVSPVDVVPEALFSVFGLVDDAVVVSWLVAALVNDTEAFLAWEKTSSARRGAGHHSGPSSAGPQDASESSWRETVASQVVR